jgi:integrase/recombinase XerD
LKDRNLNAKTIRQSVIANLLKEGKDLRVVQVFAGHKKPKFHGEIQANGTGRIKIGNLKNTTR